MCKNDNGCNNSHRIIHIFIDEFISILKNPHEKGRNNHKFLSFSEKKGSVLGGIYLFLTPALNKSS